VVVVVVVDVIGVVVVVVEVLVAVVVAFVVILDVVSDRYHEGLESILKMQLLFVIFRYSTLLILYRNY
jgi:hypothetical protein